MSHFQSALVLLPGFPCLAWLEPGRGRARRVRPDLSAPSHGKVNLSVSLVAPIEGGSIDWLVWPSSIRRVVPGHIELNPATMRRLPYPVFMPVRTLATSALPIPDTTLWKYLR